VSTEEQRWLPPQAPAEPPSDRDAFGDERPKGDDNRKRGIGGGIVAAILVALSKGKALLLLLPKLKVLSTAGTMLLSVAAYALLWGWKFAVGFVALLFVHEMGHYVQMRREGVKPGWMIFVPFLGAAVGARSLGGSALAEARVGLAGPVLGTLGAAVVAGIAVLTGDEFWRALAFTGFFLNLFNLLPVLPLDGGRAMAAMAPWMWFAGFGAIVVLMFVWPNPVIVLIALLGAFELYRRWRDRKRGEEGNPAYYAVAPRHRLAVAAVYLGLIGALVVGMDLTFVDHSGRL
jgi:Zn-dependent protease